MDMQMEINSIQEYIRYILVIWHLNFMGKML
jgi:hypothetical protein